MNVSGRPAHDVANDLNNSVVVESCHLAHRFSQTCIPSLSSLFGAVSGSSAGVHEFRLSWLSQVNTAALRCLAVVVQEFINGTKQD